MDWEAQSPVCVKDHTEGRTVFLSPEAPNYAGAILRGLLSRFESLYGHPYEGDTHGFHFELLGPQPKSALITIKAGTPQQTQIRGYRYRFCLTAPKELMHIASEGGFGEECSQGFGYIENIKG
jgi:CRISPR-associated endoribonuclease Cas6